MKSIGLAILSDPKLFNYALLALNGGACVRWALEMRWWDAAYWCCAFAITALMTWRPAA